MAKKILINPDVMHEVENTEDGILKALDNEAYNCVYCKHYNDDIDDTCKAFPNSIPIEIIDGDIRHDKPIDGDHGIQFEKE